MKYALIVAFIFLCIGCFVDAPSVVPAKDHWAVSKDGTKATMGQWRGTLEWRTVFDQGGHQYRVLAITNVSGLNPRDEISSSGQIVTRRSMPPAFYLARACLMNPRS